jgi:DNA-binding MarR family transcriptional regulator
MGKNKDADAIDRMARSCIASRLRLVNRGITNLYDTALRPLGVKVSQLNILTMVAKVGVARPEQVCEYLQLDSSTLSRNVERMRARGWLEIVAAEDGRLQPFRLTSEGKQLLADALPAWERAQGQAMRLLGSAGFALVEEAAKKLRRAKIAGG